MADRVSILEMKKGKEIITFEVYYLEDHVKGYEELFNALNPSYWVIVSKNMGVGSRSINIGEMMIEKKLLERDGFKVIFEKLTEEVKEIAHKEMCVLGLR